MTGALSAELAIATPEIATALAAMVLLLFGAFVGERSASAVNTIATVLLVGLAVLVMISAPGGGEAFSGGLVLDPLARYSKVVIALAAAAGLVLSAGYMANERLARFEYPVLILLAVLGMMMMVSSRDLIILYMGVELQSLSLYVLAAFNRDSLRASEAGLKYFVLGALSSGILLYGASLIYGFAGSTRFDEIATAVGQEPSIGLLFGLVFLMCGLAFKVSAAPFHMWTPDVYEGAPTPVTGFFAAAPKLAAMVLFARVLIEPFGAIEEQWRQVLVVIAILSLIIGSYGALVQTNIKRLMAYSSIANMGFALTPLCAGTARGVEGMLIFMTIYVISTIGVFACILAMRRREGMVEGIDELAGLSRTHPGLSLALTALLFSIAGVPPLAGFFGKLFAFLPAWEAGLHALVLVGALASVVSAFYYLRLVRVMWIDPPPGQHFMATPRELRGVTMGAAALTFPLLLLPMIVAPGRMLIERAAGALF